MRHASQLWDSMQSFQHLLCYISGSVPTLLVPRPELTVVQSLLRSWLPAALARKAEPHSRSAAGGDVLFSSCSAQGAVGDVTQVQEHVCLLPVQNRLHKRDHGRTSLP